MLNSILQAFGNCVRFFQRTAVVDELPLLTDEEVQVLVDAAVNESVRLGRPIFVRGLRTIEHCVEAAELRSENEWRSDSGHGELARGSREAQQHLVLIAALRRGAEVEEIPDLPGLNICVVRPYEWMHDSNLRGYLKHADEIVSAARKAERHRQVSEPIYLPLALFDELRGALDRALESDRREDEEGT